MRRLVILMLLVTLIYGVGPTVSRLWAYDYSCSHYACDWDCQGSAECEACVNWEYQACEQEVDRCRFRSDVPDECFVRYCHTDALGIHTCDYDAINRCCEHAHTRSFCEGAQFCAELYQNDQTPESPIVIGRGQFTYTPPKVWFNISMTGPKFIGWIAEGSGLAFLAKDRNFNGVIDDGSELFGSATPQPPYPGEEANGFVALRHEHDLDDNGVVSGKELDGLLLWRDDGDAVTESGELVPAPSSILSLSTKYFTRRGRDRYGNLRRWVGSGEGVDGHLVLEDVIFVAE